MEQLKIEDLVIGEIYQVNGGEYYFRMIKDTAKNIPFCYKDGTYQLATGVHDIDSRTNGCMKYYSPATPSQKAHIAKCEKAGKTVPFVKVPDSQDNYLIIS